MSRAALKGEGFWKHLKSTYGPHLPEYQARISALIEEIKRESPDIVLFPACTALWRYHAQLERYRREMRALPCVAFGALRIGQPVLREHSEIWANGKRLSRFDARWPVAIRLAGGAAVVAQSSTIKLVYQAPFLTLAAERSAAEPPYQLALDLGHGQYQGRYRRVLRKLKAMRMSAILSFWRNQNGNTEYRWCEADPMTFNRSEHKSGDYLDTVTFQTETAIAYR